MPYLEDLLDVGNVDAEARLAHDLDARAGPRHEHKLGTAAELVVADVEADVAETGLGWFFDGRGGAARAGVSARAFRAAATAALARAPLPHRRLLDGLLEAVEAVAARRKDFDLVGRVALVREQQPARKRHAPTSRGVRPRDLSDAATENHARDAVRTRATPRTSWCRTCRCGRPGTPAQSPSSTRPPSSSPAPHLATKKTCSVDIVSAPRQAEHSAVADSTRPKTEPETVQIRCQQIVKKDIVIAAMLTMSRP